MQVHESILFHIFKEMGYRMQYHFCSHWSYICFIKRKMSDYFGHSIRSYTFAVNLRSLLLYFSLLCIRLILIYMARYCFSHFFFLLHQMFTLGPEESLDYLRTMRMASYGLLISGPTLHLWFNFISKMFPKKDILNTLKKMFLGQAVYGPIINSVFFSYNAGLQGTICSHA